MHVLFPRRPLAGVRSRLRPISVLRRVQPGLAEPRPATAGWAVARLLPRSCAVLSCLLLSLMAVAGPVPATVPAPVTTPVTAPVPDSARPGDIAVAAADDRLDGPYVFTAANGLDAHWLCRSGLRSQSWPAPLWPLELRSPCGDAGRWTLRAPATAMLPDRVDGVRRWVAISDIHGQHALALQLLRARQVVDAAGRWQFGDGHLVVVGDVFDRGPEVTEALWFLYQLQAEARAAGGAVHVLAGNHEQLALSGDLRYVHERYQASVAAIGRPYPQLFGRDSLLGQWLRTLPTLLIIDDHLFVHGGISPAYAAVHDSLPAANARFAAALDLPAAERRKNPELALLLGRDGPLWYRGYFGDTPLPADELSAVLARFGVRRIVVGHSTQDSINARYDSRVLAIDAGLKYGDQRGELLVFADGQYWRQPLQGAATPLSLPAAPSSAASDAPAKSKAN